MHAYAGYATLLFGEGFCTTVLSSPDASGTIVFGGEVTRDSAFRAAESRFGAAIAMAQEAGETAALNFALVGRARARLTAATSRARAATPCVFRHDFTHLMTASASHAATAEPGPGQQERAARST